MASGVSAGKGTGSSAARKNALQQLPLNGLTVEARERILPVVRNPSMFRRMPVKLVEADPELYRFLIRHPEVVVNIWQLMGITKVGADRTGPNTLTGRDGAGTETEIELMYADDDTHLYYCDGTYEGPLFHQKRSGRCVLLLKSSYVPATNGTMRITSRLDVFLQVDDLGDEVLARTLQPILGRSADLNFAETIGFVERVSRTAQQNGPGMQRLAGRLRNVQPEIQAELARLSLAVHNRAQLATMAAPPPATVATSPSKRVAEPVSNHSRKKLITMPASPRSELGKGGRLQSTSDR